MTAGPPCRVIMLIRGDFIASSASRPRRAHSSRNKRSAKAPKYFARRRRSSRLITSMTGPPSRARFTPERARARFRAKDDPGLPSRRTWECPAGAVWRRVSHSCSVGTLYAPPGVQRLAFGRGSVSPQKSACQSGVEGYVFRRRRGQDHRPVEHRTAGGRYADATALRPPQSMPGPSQAMCGFPRSGRIAPPQRAGRMPR